MSLNPLFLAAQVKRKPAKKPPAKDPVTGISQNPVLDYLQAQQQPKKQEAPKQPIPRSTREDLKQRFGIDLEAQKQGRKVPGVPISQGEPTEDQYAKEVKRLKGTPGSIEHAMGVLDKALPNLPLPQREFLVSYVWSSAGGGDNIAKETLSRIIAEAKTGALFQDDGRPKEGALDIVRKFKEARGVPGVDIATPQQQAAYREELRKQGVGELAPSQGGGVDQLPFEMRQQTPERRAVGNVNRATEEMATRLNEALPFLKHLMVGSPAQTLEGLISSIRGTKGTPITEGLPAGAIAGAANLPAHIAADLGMAASRDSTAEERIRAALNVLGNILPVEELALGAASKAGSKALQAFKKPSQIPGVQDASKVVPPTQISQNVRQQPRVSQKEVSPKEGSPGILEETKSQEKVAQASARVTPLEGADVTGLARRFEDIERSNRNLEPTRRASRSIDALAQEGRQARISGAVNAESVVQESARSGRPLNKLEIAAVADYKRELANRSNELVRKLESGQGIDSKTKLGLLREHDEIIQKMNEVSDAAQNSRTEWHEGGLALQIAYAPDYSRASLVSRAKAKNLGRELSTLDRKALDESSARIASLQSELDQARAQLSKDLFRTGVRSKVPLERQAALARNIRRRMGFEAGSAPRSGMKSKQVGAISLPDDQMNLMIRDVRSLARGYIADGAETLDDLLLRFHKDVPGIGDEDWLGMLSGRYRKRALEADVEKLRVERALSLIQRQAEFRELSVPHKVVSVAGEVLNNLSRSIKAGFDISILLFQGRKALKTDPGSWLRAWAPQLETIAKGEGAALKSQARREAHPLYRRLVRAGVDFTEMGGALARQEETGAGWMLEALRQKGPPVLKQLAEANYRSGASATEAMNSVRFNLAEKMARLNPDDAQYLEDIANLVNVMTGRPVGKIKQLTLNPIASKVAFAPGFTGSKWQYALGQPLLRAKTTAGRTQVAKTYAKDIAVTAAATLAAKHFLESSDLGYVEIDPRSSNFGKMRVGEYVYDLFGVDTEVARLLWRMSHGTINQKGVYTPPSERQAGSVAWNYLKNKAAPVARVAAGSVFGTYDPQIGKARPQGLEDFASMFVPMGIERSFSGDDVQPGFNPYLLINVLTDVERRKMDKTDAKLESMLPFIRDFYPKFKKSLNKGSSPQKSPYEKLMESRSK